MKLTEDQNKLLAEKLDATKVQPPSQYGPKGSYLEGWHVIAEANRIFGFDGWSYEVLEANCVAQQPRAIGQQKREGFGVTYISKVRVHVAGVMREDYGAGHGYDVDLGLGHESAIKEAVTDALKRALRTFGNPFGLALYDKTRANVEDPAETERQNNLKAATDSLYAEISSLSNERGLATFWKDNQGVIAAMEPETKRKFIAKKDELKSRFSKPDTVGDILDTFGGKVVNETLTREQSPLEAGE